MIKYKLRCKSTYCSDNDDFDGWFQNIETFEKQMDLGLINCPICGSENIIKSLATPNVKKSKNKNLKDNKEKHDFEITYNQNSYTGIENTKNITTMLRTIKKEVQKNSTFVGDEFVAQARSMKNGKIKEKPIHGYGSKKDIEKLSDEGIDVLSIPWISDDH